jgi:transcriptional regulator with XRE-family HTH domain
VSFLEERRVDGLRDARLSKGIGQRQLADMLDVNRTTLQRWENRDRVPRKYLPLLRRILDLDESAIEPDRYRHGW